MILPTDSLDTFCSFGSLNVDKATGATWKMYNFRIRHGVLGWSHKRRWKDTVTLGMRIPLPQHLPSWALPMRCGVRWMEKRKLGVHRPPLPTPGVIRHCAQVHSMRWGTLHLRAHIPSAQSKPRPMTWFPHSGSARWTVGRPAIQRLFVPPTIFFLCFKDKKSKLDSHVLQSTVLSYGALKDFSEIPQCLPLRKPWVWGWPSPRTSWQWLWANS